MPALLGALLALAAPEVAGDDPVATARAFLTAMRDGDVAAITRLHSADAVFVGGDIGLPMAGAEAALAMPGLKSCAIGTLLPEPGSASPTLFADQTPASVRAGRGVTVDATLLCPDKAGGRNAQRSGMKIVVADGLVAALGLVRSAPLR